MRCGDDPPKCARFARGVQVFAAGTRRAYEQRMSRKLLVGTVLLSAGILAIVFNSNRRTGVYSRSVSEFLAHPIRDEVVRVQGRLVPGSLCRQSEPCEWRFSLD